MKHGSRFLCLQLLGAVLYVGLAAGCATRGTHGTDVSFSAVGDGPRADADWAILSSQLDRVDKDGRSAFLIHLGDITKGTDVLPETYYARVAALLEKSKTPVFIVPGDNEWNDLDNPAQGWEFWTRHFMGFEKRFPKAPEAVRQAARPENFAFALHGVLFVGLNLVGGTVHDTAEWTTRHSDNLAWVREQFAAHPDARAAVICAQARPKEKQEDFFGPFCEAAQAFGKPVLYLHGDGHVYEVEQPWRKPNLTRVQVDQVSKGPPLLVTVTLESEKPFQFSRLAPLKEERMRRPEHFGPRGPGTGMHPGGGHGKLR